MAIGPILTGEVPSPLGIASRLSVRIAVSGMHQRMLGKPTGSSAYRQSARCLLETVEGSEEWHE